MRQHASCYLFTFILSTLLVSGCSTERQLLKQRLSVLKYEEAALQNIKNTFSSELASVEGPGKVNFFISDDLINSVLKAADGIIIPVPDVRGLYITVNSIRTEFKMGYPLVNIDATAKKDRLNVSLDLVGVARVIPTILTDTSGKPSELELKIYVESLVPRAKWGVFDFRIHQIVRDFAQVQINDKLQTIGIIHLPIETDIPLKLPARQTQISFTGTHATISTPDFSMNGKALVTKVLTLTDGLHIYGEVKLKKESEHE